VNPQIENSFLSSSEEERKARIWQALKEASRNLGHNQGLHFSHIYVGKAFEMSLTAMSRKGHC